MGFVVQRIEMSWSGRLPPQNTQKLQKNKGLRQKENFGVKIRYLTTVYDKHVLNYFHKGKTSFALDKTGCYNINARLGYQGGKGQNNIIGNLDLKLVPSFSLYQSLENWQSGNSKEDLPRKQL